MRASYFKADDPYVECRECFALDWRHGVGAALLAAQKGREPPAADEATSATTIGVFRAVVDASVNDAIAAAAAEARPGSARPRRPCRTGRVRSSRWATATSGIFFNT